MLGHTMDMLTQTNDIFFTRTGLDPDQAEAIVRDALANADDGELFMEMRHAETLLFDDGRLKSASYDQSSGLVCARSPVRPMDMHMQAS